MRTRMNMSLLAGMLTVFSAGGAWGVEAATSDPAAAADPSEPAATDAADPAAFEASSEPAQEELSFDEVAEQAPAPAAGLTHWYDIVHLSGRFDLNYELDNPALVKGDVRKGRFKNYHHFLFLKVTPTERLSLEAEIADKSYYELRYRFPHDVEVHFGRIWVPFGATPFHHYYGGRQGDPFLGLLVPNVWAEYGASVGYPLLSSKHLSLSGDTYVIRGFDGIEGSLLGLTSGGTDGRFAVGQRLKIGLGTKAAVWGSALYNKWGEDDQGRLLLWGLDARLDYGLIPLPFLRDFSARAALARADIRDPLINPELTPDGWYWRYGDYIEVAYGGLRPWTTLRVRYGTIIDYNLEETAKDNHNWEAAIQVPIGGYLSVLAQYQWNMEEIDEVDNDLFRLQVAMEF